LASEMPVKLHSSCFILIHRREQLWCSDEARYILFNSSGRLPAFNHTMILGIQIETMGAGARITAERGAAQSKPSEREDNIMAQNNRIGDLLVEAGIISVKTLVRALDMQRESDKRLGLLLMELKIVTEVEVLEALARQSGLKIVRNFAVRTFPGGLFKHVARPMAMERMIFPLDENRDTLTIATLDPFDHETFSLLAEKTGLNIHRRLAIRDDILDAIHTHYAIDRRLHSHRKKILVVDPSPIITRYLQSNLERNDLEVRSAHDGIAGLKSAYTHHPDLVICDLKMPRMDAYMFLFALKAHPDLARTPVILMVARADAAEEEQALSSGFADFICKPTLPGRVIDMIEKTLSPAALLKHVENR
jgi:CheY-like chemotaxis protein